jgi:azurin
MAGAVGAQQVVPPPAEKVDQRVAIAVVPGKLAYDLEEFYVKPGSQVKITLKNGDSMQHNFVLCKPGPGVGLAVAQKAWALGGAAISRQYIPDSTDVLFHSRLVDPGGSDSFIFKVPSAQGDYPYVCTLPGHAMTMHGVMHVTLNLAAAKKQWLHGISYRVFPGARSLADAARQGPSEESTAAVFDTAPAKQQPRPFAIMFQGTLVLPVAGESTFRLGADEAELSVDGKSVLAVENSSKSAKVTLAAGAHTLALRYRCDAEDPWLQASVKPPMERNEVSLTAPLPKRMVLSPGATPVVERVLLQGSPSAGAGASSTSRRTSTGAAEKSARYSGSASISAARLARCGSARTNSLSSNSSVTGSRTFRRCCLAWMARM